MFHTDSGYSQRSGNDITLTFVEHFDNPIHVRSYPDFDFNAKITTKPLHQLIFIPHRLTAIDEIARGAVSGENEQFTTFFDLREVGCCVLFIRFIW